MVDNNYNTIKPVESLQNVKGLTPARRRKERKHRRNPHEQNEQERKEELNGLSEKELNDKIVENGAGRHSIDYCA
ncbi:MAG: hypothetical protein DRP62_02600 [Planctomycetota bacterium]|nr:MAG: hypothetical protein DRP62_02600 [Planctomycetota bacterium]